MIPLAWKNAVHKKLRTAVAAAGVSFAILMIFLQLGFYGSVKNTAGCVLDKLDFDIIMVSPLYKYIGQPGYFPMTNIYLAAGHGAVTRSIPLYARFSKWRNIQTGEKRAIMAIAFNPKDYPFNTSGIKSGLSSLKKADTLLIDRLSLPLLGPMNAGLTTEINKKSVYIGGDFSWGIGFIADGLVLISDRNFLRLFPSASLKDVNLGLITLRQGASVEHARRDIQRALPRDVLVLTRQEIEKREGNYWLTVTATGPMFGAGVIVAFIVGMVVLYQILSNEIMDGIREYATLKAMGYKNIYFAQTVVQHGAVIAVMGYLPAYGISLFLYGITRSATNLPIYMTLERAVFVLLLAILMCAASAYLSLGKIKLADPGDLF